jgi:Double zinc ribbon
VTDVERLFRQIVRNLSATDPARLRRPLPLSDVRDHIVPYRTNRRPLELESSEDYELALIRLCAGEGGFVRTEPAEVRAEFQAEITSPNPDLSILRKYDNAVVSLDAGSLARALDPGPDRAFAPPGYAAGHAEVREPITPPGLPPEELARPRCTHCKGELPGGRAVNFCPHCGRSQALTNCPVCQEEVEAGWRHCVSCGYLISEV